MHVVVEPLLEDASSEIVRLPKNTLADLLSTEPCRIFEPSSLDELLAFRKLADLYRRKTKAHLEAEIETGALLEIDHVD